MESEELFGIDQQQSVVCPNCGRTQRMTGADARCDECGYLMNPTGSDKQPMSPTQVAGRADPTEVPPSEASGGIGRTTDGTQTPRRVPTAVPGKPMAPTVEDPAGSSTQEGQARDPSPGAHAERGGSG